MFPSAISRYLVSDTGGDNQAASSLTFPSAISRYLVSNILLSMGVFTYDKGFHPLYRGTWFPTTTLMTLSSIPAAWFPSAISRYLVSNLHPEVEVDAYGDEFPSAISRYLVSNLRLVSLM